MLRRSAHNTVSIKQHKIVFPKRFSRKKRKLLRQECGAVNGVFVTLIRRTIPTLTSFGLMGVQELILPADPELVNRLGQIEV